ncbi:MAG TPA: glutamate synthase central domain-containing protein, partial [Gemmataceae bacterium]|nr:glutamate synthase central domain-containing protein [Gemmataceae bacterium]
MTPLSSLPGAYPPKQGLYDPWYEHDACGVGFIADIKGRKSHDLVAKGIRILLNLEHRGACGCEKNTGDGAGILLQTPHKFLAREADRLGFRLPPPGEYAAGLIFLPAHKEDRVRCERLFEQIIREEGQHVLGWRNVPTDNSPLGLTACAVEPVVRQIFIGRSGTVADEAAFERKLYVIRRLVEKRVSRSAIPQRGQFYVPSLSHKTICFKGMLNASQLVTFFPDLNDASFEAALAMVHSRFSTNTFPSWSRAHPYRYISHNGEINTLRGNINWMHARQSMMRSELFGEDLKKILTVIDLEGSDSAMLDNVLELLHLAGRSLPHAMMMMVPEPYGGHESMSPEKKAFYEYHSCLMEPWDGPASIAFTDGVRIGATLDRNGLRPARYYVTKDDLVVMASEVGVLDIPPERVVQKGRLQPGRMFLVDTAEKRIVSDDELKHRIAKEQPYQLWLQQHLVKLEDLPKPENVIEPDHETVLRRQEVFGYTAEDVRILINPMATDGTEPIGSMGNDT